MTPKFRGFRTRTEEWVEGNLIYREEPYLHDIVIPVGDSGTISYAVERDSVGQWTGLKDVNGEDIFEGDIVKVGTLEDEPIGEIKWNPKSAEYRVTNHINPFGEEHVSFYHAKLFEVIGNIHENRELLEVSE